MGSSGSGSRGARRHAGVGDALGHKLGRARAGWMAGAVGLARPRSRAGRGGLQGLPLLFLFLFYFSSPLFEFKFGLKFEFQIGAPYSLEF